ncbi:MAG: GNAT family N-acetyltransferase [Chloroflexi bacterium]|nr:GNAT family N-acetyltransferase [Chloroflexota bacterium]
MQPELLRRALDVNWRNLALGSESFEAEGAVFVRNRDFPGIYDANFIYAVAASSPDAIASLLARAAKEYEHAAELTFRIDPGTPAAFEARLGLVAYERSSSLVLLLEGPLSGTPRSADIRPIDSEAGWDAYFDLKRADWRDHAARVGEDPENTAVPDGLAATNRLKCPPVRYFLAYVDGKPCGFFNDWEGIDGVGQVEDLFVLPAYRHRGIATALIQHCVADARAHGAGPLVIVADPADTPKNIYAAMGCRPIALCRQYGKKL